MSSLTEIINYHQQKFDQRLHECRTIQDTLETEIKYLRNKIKPVMNLFLTEDETNKLHDCEVYLDAVIYMMGFVRSEFNVFDYTQMKLCIKHYKSMLAEKGYQITS